ncbi:glycogen debranching protein GlgX [Tuwongella immobilis]|uniref:Glycosyl hydrolase family 13 catalytic domain-containing protein n=1 Tax=Tuwongella immobilis TaxID=692036 RepID=A0A6C2YQ56_9BACT|nr:glycogen debranching protein GlgX [Tuwongella immobilis]VIP03253.1 glycogen debranching protein : Isoamylase OS=Isosphaera pallida (strain ATCC 43644 / DSM 9630 / IS1B) GN=Isop_0445 PE=4 SV=1: CBM_48: Alpha-amylase [Tuwongella immobilis]VTS03846.1 glycogen debranching protein : Isoamylase OS=Isosphaera pallida (strain ATCC 43644 / DSM 9630 / IS1B) GN=Isop_0445 PE=4 SV=1: CBM_48: Alpha-amylase [Tuwongella immobilis]
MTAIQTYRGRPAPLGATQAFSGVNFALLCRHGTKIHLVIQPLEQDHPILEIPLDGRTNRTGDHWHIRVSGLPRSFRYGWRVDGPKGPTHRFDPSVVLLDPASTMLSNGSTWAATCETDPHRSSRRSVYHRNGPYDWQEDAPPLIAYEDSIIYELHVRGFTCHPTAGVQHPGTFRGLIEKIPYLKWLGVTAIELLPIHEFDECDCPFVNPDTGEPLRNFWGYNSISFAAPKGAYASNAAEHGQFNEFRDFIRACHSAGIEIILDVVFNHTGEGDDRGRTYSFRGLDNELYYLLSSDGHYLNYSGCGNTLNCNHPVVRDLILTCLRYWVGDMHVDGLRFDLASILGRDSRGNLMIEPPIIEMITEDGILAGTKLIAEPWDAAGAYQVGGFPYGRRWSEWNGHYRDDVRRFWRGDLGFTGAVATRLCGSADLYEWNGRKPRHSINFITCHDGFTLADLVSYNHKHNWANGEGNRDGMNENYSWNCGVEGETDDPHIHGLRRRQAKNLFATLMLSQGVPMMLAGDEFLRTQQGNNNAWCQDNDISWVDWSLANSNADFLRFSREMIHLRKRHPVLRRRRFFQGEVARTRIDGQTERLVDVVWHGQQPRKPDFSANSRAIAFALDGRLPGQEDGLGGVIDCDLYVAMNASSESLPFLIPRSPSGRIWRRVVDTALASPLDILPETEAPRIVDNSTYIVAPNSLIVLISES